MLHLMYGEYIGASQNSMCFDIVDHSFNNGDRLLHYIVTNVMLSGKRLSSGFKKQRTA